MKKNPSANYPVTAASDFILKKLVCYRQGRVHSVYRKTINLSFDGQLVSLQAANSPLSPISLITPLPADEMAALSVCVNDPVTITSGTLQIDRKCAFNFSSVSPQPLLLSTVLAQKELSFLKSQILSALFMRNAKSFDLLFSEPDMTDDIAFLAIAKKHLGHASCSLAISDWDTASEELCHLIGLGTGLTPGGDDFLCGVLAGLILCGNAAHPFAHSLSKKLLLHLGDTNDISAAFLQCALAGQFSKAVNLLTSLPSQIRIYSSFSEIGHSSGTDTLSGIVYILHNRHVLQHQNNFIKKDRDKAC